MAYPWIKDSKYVNSTVTGYLAVTSPNGLYLTDGVSNTTITPTSVTSTTFNGNLNGSVSNATNATNATNVAITEDNASTTALYPVFVSNNTGNLPLKVDKTTTPLSYIPSSGTFTANTFVGALTGNATSATTATTATTATRATNIAGGSGAQIPYQSSANTTAFLANGTAGQFLKSNGTTLAPSWDTPSTAASTIDITDINGNNFDYLFTFVSAGGASQTLRADITPEPFTFNPLDGSIKKTTSDPRSGPAISISPINTSLPVAVAEGCKLTLLNNDPQIIGVAQMDDYNSSNFDFGGNSAGDFSIYRQTNFGGEGPYGTEYAGVTTFDNQDTGSATAVMYYRQTGGEEGPAGETGIRVYHQKIQMFSGDSFTADTNIADFTSRLITLIPPVSFTQQLTLPDTLTTASFASGTLTADFGSVSTGIFTATLTANMTGIAFSGGRTGGQYVIYVSASGGTRTIASSLTPTATTKTNYATAISVLTTSVAILTVTYDGTNYLIAGSAFNST